MLRIQKEREVKQNMQGASRKRDGVGGRVAGINTSDSFCDKDTILKLFNITSKSALR
jgi:hypothetical protein